MEESYFDAYGDAIAELKIEAIDEVKTLNKLSDMDFLRYVLNHGDQTEMNNLVKNHQFKAYDIAKQCYQAQKLTNKQRLAIANVYLFTQTNYYRYTDLIDFV